MRAFLVAQGHEVPERRATLGALSAKLAEVGLLSKNGQAILELTGTQRNHFAHKLYDLLTDRAESALLPLESLEDADVGTFTDYAWSLTENLNGLTATVKRRLGEAGDADSSWVLL